MTKAVLCSILENYTPTAQERHCHRWLVELYRDPKLDEGTLNKRLTDFVADNNAEILLVGALISVRTQLKMKESGDQGLYGGDTLRQKAAATFIESARSFTYEHVLSYCGSRHTAQDVLRKYMQAGRIRRVERGSYVNTAPAALPGVPG
jgi:hypothetical protein